MRLFDCTCGNTLFFDNSLCTVCGREVGWCPDCAAISSLDPAGDGTWRCTTAGHPLRKCRDYAAEGVCNRMVSATQPGDLCDCCVLNETIPDLGIEGNAGRWARLEAAKRRLIYALDTLRLPYGRETSPPLRFAFMGDARPVAGDWRRLGPAETVYTGHAEGLVTINLREAEDAAREALRVDFGEAHRTLIGHFRHEVGHYYWDLLIRDRDEAAFAALFGDPADPPYGAALERHYANGAPQDWAARHVSAYASAHPWEDWAETWALYLDIASVLDTAAALGMTADVPGEIGERVARYRRIGLFLNELNREMGLLDFAPHAIPAPVEAKLAYVDTVVRRAARSV